MAAQWSFWCSDRTKYLTLCQGQWRETDACSLNTGATLQSEFSYHGLQRECKWWVRCETHTDNSYSWWWTLSFLSFFALQDWSQDFGHRLEESHLIYSFYIAWFIFFNFSFFRDPFLLWKENLSAHVLMVAGSLEIPIKEQINRSFLPAFQKTASMKERNKPLWY